MKDYIEERAVEIAGYIIETKATVRQTAKKFGISKSTVHTDVTKQNGCASLPKGLAAVFHRYLFACSNDACRCSFIKSPAFV